MRKDAYHTMKLINSQVEKKTVSSDDPPVASKSVTEVKGKRKRNNTPSKKQVKYHLLLLETIEVRCGKTGGLANRSIQKVKCLAFQKVRTG